MPRMANTQTSDFSQGSVSSNILRLALPMTVAQLINVLYSVVDRMYIGHLPNAAADALTGIGLTFPIISIVTAFANLFGMGGSPLFSIERGRGHLDKARQIMGNTFSLLVGTGVVLTAVILLIKKPLLYAFGASDVTYPYADGYITIYICGSIFVMVSLGMNQFINAQGFGRKGMMTVLIGAVTNIVLDPIFIFVFGMGVQGAALATILSQFLSAVWAVSFLRGKKALIRIERPAMRLNPRLVWQILCLGFSSFVMAITNSIVQVACNSTLQAFGGDLYVGVMTILNSVREVVSTPINGVTSAAQPVMGFNYGAQKYRRVRSGILFTTVRPVLQRRGPAGGRCSQHAHLLLRVFYDEPANGGPKRRRGPGALQTGGVFLPVPQGDHRHAFDAAAPLSLWLGSDRCVPGGAHLQLHRGRGLLHHHAADHLA